MDGNGTGELVGANVGQYRAGPHLESKDAAETIVIGAMQARSTPKAVSQPGSRLLTCMKL